MYRIFMAFVLAFVFIGGYRPLAAQSPVVSGSAHVQPDQAAATPPRELDASDGVYDRFVLIRWDVVAQASGYKVFRTTNPRQAQLQEISAGWQKSNWFCDYTAQPGVEYYYAIAANHQQEKPALSIFDKGYVRSRTDTALEQDLLSDNEAVANPSQRFLLIANITTDRNAYAPGTQAQVSVSLKNIFSQEAPRTEIRYYLSTDTYLHWNDRFLLAKSYSSFPPENTFDLLNTLPIPQDVSPGTYYLIVVAAPEGEVIHSKMEAIPFVIE